jgi:LysM repeat protein
MARWKKWTKLAAGPYQGTPQLGSAGLGASGYTVVIREKENVVRFTPEFNGQPSYTMKIRGAEAIAQMPEGHWYMGGFLATGKDGCLYTVDYKDNNQSHWKKMGGPGRFLSAVYSLSAMDGSAEVFGEGIEHQLAYGHIDANQRQKQEITDWSNLGQPGIAGGKKGINGRPAIAQTRDQLHIFVRGQDNHLWQISAKNNWPEKLSFGRWNNLGGGLSAAPVVVTDGEQIECFVLGEKNELFVNTWDDGKWSGFNSLGGQLKGLPRPLRLMDQDTTFIFGRGVQNQLWYRRRSGQSWTRWQAIGEDLGSDPAVWEESYNAAGGTISCVVRRQDGALWERTLALTEKEHKGSNKTQPSTIMYTVQQGDWLYRIARALSVDVTALKKANRQIKDFDSLRPGDTLAIPLKLRDGHLQYIVQEGNTLSGIAAGLGTTVAVIMSANRLRNAQMIRAGAPLQIPVK